MECNGLKNDRHLDRLQKQTFDFFWNEANPGNGLVSDRTAPDWPAGIASTGLALTSFPVAVERGFIARDKAAERTLAALRFFLNCCHGPQPEAAGFHGFFYKYLDMHKGRRARMSEISLFDSAILFAGALTAAMYFDNDNKTESEIRYSADQLYRRADWRWAMNDKNQVLQGWKPERGFTGSGWKGYDEAMLLYILGLGSPTSPLPPESYKEWTAGYEWISFYGFEYLYAGPMFVHQLPHVWLDLRGISDEYMRKHDSDYFENSVRATLVQYRYAIVNPLNYEGYGKYFWGITLSDGPGPSLINMKGTDREFFGHMRRGAPFGPDDGTISPWALVAALPFAPDLVLPAIDCLLQQTDLNILNSYGFRSAVNPTFPHKSYNPHGWRSPVHNAISQGPSLALIENYRSGLLWDLLKKNQYIASGLLSAGFEGGWLDEAKVTRKQEQTTHAG